MQDIADHGPAADAQVSASAVRAPERFISYAQNCEDVMLWRALQSYTPGFYIDLGAGDPVADSVTKAFYDRGWRGINVEPMAASFDRLRPARPRDINLSCAVDAERGTKTFFSVDEGSGLSTGIGEMADGYRAAGRTITEIQVQTDTLAGICATYVAQEIHFLKVDVEGSEDLAFQGADFSSWRPWIIVIESTEAAAQPQAPTWHPQVSAAGYAFVYYDGLNRYYIANEKRSLLEPHFKAPPNWFDNYVRASEVDLEQLVADTAARADADEQARVQAERAASAATAELSALRAALDAATAESAGLQDRVRALRTELDACYQQLYEDSRQLGWLSAQRQQLVTQMGHMERSRSWRMLYQVRVASEKVRRYRAGRA